MRMFLPEVLLRLLIVALGRSALAAICLAALDAYGMFILNKDDRERYNHLLMLTSQLKSEVIWMNKNTNRIEDTMAVSYALYNQLNQMAVQEQSAAGGTTGTKGADGGKGYSRGQKGILPDYERYFDCA